MACLSMERENVNTAAAWRHRCRLSSHRLPTCNKGLLEFTDAFSSISFTAAAVAHQLRVGAAEGMKVSLGATHASLMAAAFGLVRSPWCPGSPHLRGNIFNVTSRRTSSGTCFRRIPTTTALAHAADASGVASCAGSTLLVGSQQDAASRAMISALLARGDWVETSPGIEQDGTRDGKAYTHKKSPTSMWLVQGRLLDLDDADRRWALASSGLTDEQQKSEHLTLPSDVVFLSKHVAKSGVPALCVHPIGIPNVSEAHIHRV